MKGSGFEENAAPRIHHLALRTARMEAVETFYKEVLGLEVVRCERPRSVWLGVGDGAVLMVEARGPHEPDLPQGSLELFAFRVTPERKRTIRALAVARGCFDGETEHTVYLRDPDGRRVGISTHPLGTER